MVFSFCFLYKTKGAMFFHQNTMFPSQIDIICIWYCCLSGVPYAYMHACRLFFVSLFFSGKTRQDAVAAEGARD